LRLQRLISAQMDVRRLCAALRIPWMRMARGCLIPAALALAACAPKPTDLACLNATAIGPAAQAPQTCGDIADPTPIGPAKSGVSIAQALAESDGDARLATGSADTLSGATGEALDTSEVLKEQDARIAEAEAGVDLARTASNPTADLKLTLGPGYSHQFETSGTGRDIDIERKDGRLEATLSLRQLVYDFGATERDIERARLFRTSEAVARDEQAEDLAQQVALSYLRVIEARAVLRIVDDTIAAHRQLAEIVQANEREGNGTAADVNRVNARLVDIAAIRSDVTLQMQAGEEEFQRLTGRKPGGLTPFPNLRPFAPRDVDETIALAARRNPKLVSLDFVSQSLDQEREALRRSSTLPRVALEVDGVNKSSLDEKGGRNQLEGKALVSVSYRLWDGGVHDATDRQVEQRRVGNDMRFADHRRRITSEIRQAYRAIAASENKRRLVQSGVETSERVQALYLEQFKAGQRTVFELLDTQMATYSARRGAIEARYEGERALITILRSMGILRNAIAKAKPGQRDAIRSKARPGAAVAEAVLKRKTAAKPAKDDAAVAEAAPPPEPSAGPPPPLLAQPAKASSAAAADARQSATP
jgi:outer membrane protein, adhesin transport system